MITPNVAGGGYYFQISSEAGKWSWKVSANNIRSVGQYFYVSEINSPFGRLVDVDYPIPGDVVDAIYESLQSFKSQLDPALSLTSSSSVSVTVSEGDANFQGGPITFVNSGAFGSMLCVTATPNVPWLVPVPSVVSGIGKNQSGGLSYRIINQDLLSDSSPYSALLNLQSNSSAPPVSVSFSVNVLPRPVTSLNVQYLSFTYTLATQSATLPQTFTITNVGPIGSLLNYVITKAAENAPWCTFSPSAGGPLSSGQSQQVTVTVGSLGIPWVPANYSTTLVINSRNSSNGPQVVVVNLTVV
jgi:hypothetical protein